MHTYFENAPWFRIVQDIVDIVLVTFLIYSIFRLIRGTRTVNMLIGLGICILVYYLSSVAELYTLNWILYHFFEAFSLSSSFFFRTRSEDFLHGWDRPLCFLYSHRSKMKKQSMRSFVVASCLRISGLGL